MPRSMACSNARSPSLKVKSQKCPAIEPHDTEKRPTDIPTLAQGAKRGTQRAVQRVLVVGPREVPSFILDVDTGDVLWDHRRRPVKEALAIISKLRPYAGRIWCTDQELHLILTHLRPFLRPTGGRWWGEEAQEGGSLLASEWEALVVFDHDKLRAEALYRYDNPGSITLKTVAAVVGGTRGKAHARTVKAASGKAAEAEPAQQQQQLLVAHLDAHSVLGYLGVGDLRLSGISGSPQVCMPQKAL